MKTKKLITLCIFYCFTILPSISQTTYRSQNGYAIETTTKPNPPLRVLIAFVVFNPDGSGNCDLSGGACWAGNNLPR